MTETCPSCGEELLSGQMVTTHERSGTIPVEFQCQAGGFPLFMKACWNCGYTDISMNVERSLKKYFIVLGKTLEKILKSNDLISIGYLAKATKAPVNLLLKYVHEFLDWINDPKNHGDLKMVPYSMEGYSGIFEQNQLKLEGEGEKALFGLQRQNMS